MRMTAMERNGRCYANLSEAEARYAREPLRVPMAGKPGVTAGIHRRIRSIGRT